MASTEINAEVASFFDVDFTGMSNGDKEKKIEEINSNLNIILEACALLYDYIPTGKSVQFKFIKGRIKLLNTANRPASQIGSLIVSKPTGVMDLTTQSA